MVMVLVISILRTITGIGSDIPELDIHRCIWGMLVDRKFKLGTMFVTGGTPLFFDKLEELVNGV